MPEPDSAPKVLVSYSHDSPEHMARVLALSDRLRAEGVESQVDQYETSPPEGWPRWTWNQVEWADFVLVVCTATYHRRFRGQEEKGKGRGVNWEGVVITQDLYDAAALNTKFIPVAFTEDDAAHIPVILRGATFYVLGDEEGYEALYRHLTGQPRTLKPGLGRLRPLPQRTPHTPEDGGAWPPADPPSSDEPRPVRAEEEDERTTAGRPALGGKRLLILLAAVVGVAAVAFGLWRYASAPSRVGPVQYRGKVFANNDRRAVPGARVIVESQGADSFTDSEGEFSLKLSRPLDRARFRVEAKGFDVYERELELSPSSPLTFGLTESKSPPPPPTPTPSPTRRPIIPRPKPRYTPCTVQGKANGDC